MLYMCWDPKVGVFVRNDQGMHHAINIGDPVLVPRHNASAGYREAKVEFHLREMQIFMILF